MENFENFENQEVNKELLNDYLKHLEKQKEYNKKHVEKHKDKYTLKTKCENCGGSYTYWNKKHHNNTKKHILSLSKPL